MPDSKFCGAWHFGDVELFAGQFVLYKGKLAQVIRCNPENVPDGFVPITYEEERGKMLRVPIEKVLKTNPPSVGY